MGGRFQNSLALAKSSWNVLRDDKQLTLLPLISLVVTLAVLLAVLLPIGLIVRNGSGGYSGSKPLVWILGFIGAIVLSYIVVFFNAALVFAANSRFQGQPVTIGEAIHAARERSHVLLPWAVVSATVSVVLRGIEQRGGIFGRIIGSLAGVAWSVVTFLVLPVLVFEGIGPIAAVKRSGELFKRTWGENLMTNAGIGLVGLFATIARRVAARDLPGDRRADRRRGHRALRRVGRRGDARDEHAHRDLPDRALPLRHRRAGARLRARGAAGIVPHPGPGPRPRRLR